MLAEPFKDEMGSGRTVSACSDAEELDLDSEDEDSELELSTEDSVEDDMSNVNRAALQRGLANNPMQSGATSILLNAETHAQIRQLFLN